MTIPSATAEKAALHAAAETIDDVAFAQNSNLLRTAARVLYALESGDLTAASHWLMMYRTRFTKDPR